MSLRLAVLFFGTIFAFATPVGSLPPGRVVDLTHPFDAKTLYWPTEEGFVLERELWGQNDKGFFYASNKFRTAEHGGTHVDAPLHFAEGGRSVDQIPLGDVMGEAVVVDVSATCAKNRDYQVTVEDFQRWEKQQGAIPKRAIVLLRTGFGRFWPDRARYLGTPERGAQAVPKLHFPGLSPKAAEWLIAERAVKAVGLDTASIDYGQSTMFETHRILHARNIPNFENLANLDQLPPKGITLLALPMKIAGGTGGPVRAIAFVR